MRKNALDTAGERELVEQVIRELKSRLQEAEAGDLVRRQAVILGSLLPEEEKAVREFYHPAAFPAEQDWDVAIVAQISVNTMAQLSLGIPQDARAAFLLQGLLEGKKVYILESALEYRRYRDTACKTLYRLYQDYEDALAKLGVCVIKDILEFRDLELAPAQPLAGRSICLSEESGARASVPGTSEVLDLTGKKLLRESDLNQARVRSCTKVIIGKRTILTPLAQDYIHNHNLKVQRT